MKLRIQETPSEILDLLYNNKLNVVNRTDIKCSNLAPEVDLDRIVLSEVLKI
jgi:hypothetical protein